jgi:hypothetical protein
MDKRDVTTKLAATEASLKRWQTRLKRAATRVNDLDRLRRRYQLLLLNPDQPVAAVVKVKRPTFDIPAGPIPAIVVENVKLGLDKPPIPDFLDRSDPHIAKKLTEARKQAEAEERKKMPLTGKAALAKIKAKK